MRYKVRKPLLTDADSAELLSKDYIDDMAKLFPFKVDCRTLVQVALNNHSNVLTFDDEVVGILVGMIINSLVGDEQLFQVLSWYVARQHRSHGLKLLRETEREVKSLGIDKIILGHADTDNKRVPLLYKKMNYVPFEHQYVKVL